MEIQRLAMEGSVEVAQRLGIPLVATSDATTSTGRMPKPRM